MWKIFNYILPYLLLDFLKHIIIFLLYKIKGMPGKIKTEISKIGQMNIFIRIIWNILCLVSFVVFEAVVYYI